MRNRPLCSVCLIVFVIMCICIRAGGAKFERELRPSPLERTIQEDKIIQFTGQVYQKEIKENYQLLYLKDVSIIYQEQSLRESKLIIYDKTKQKIKIGNIVEGRGSVSFFESARNSGNFDQKLYYQKQDIHASVWAETLEIVSDGVLPIKNKLYCLREKWSAMLCTAMGEKDGSTFSAILLGEKSGMDAELKELYQVNGIAHILAISGLHLSLIGVGMYRLLRRMTGSYPVGGMAGILFLLSYIFMIGFTVSAVRALVMFLFRVGADMAGRHYDSPTALSAAAVIVIIWRPLYIYDGGFWMSFGAVLATIIVFPVFKSLPVQGLMASISIHLMLLPVLLYYFYEIPAYGVLLNLMVIPLLTVLLIVGLAGSALWLLCSSIGQLSFGLCRGIFRLYEWSCGFVLRLPKARLVAGQPKEWEIFVYYLLLAIAVLLVRCDMRGRHWKEECRKEECRNGDCRRSDWWKKAVAVVFVCAGMLLLIVPYDTHGVLEIAVLDVGQGDGIFVRGPEGITYLVDGGSSDISKVGEYRIEPFLLSKGVGKLDYVFLSHGDQDHMNGIEQMIDRQQVGVEIGAFVLPEQSVWDENLCALAQKAKEKGIRVLCMTGGDKLEEGELSIVCIQPEASESKLSAMGEREAGEAGNASSMVLAVNYGTFDMLLTGDVEAEGEELLTENLRSAYPKTEWEVLKVAHHGSKNSTSEEFLEIVKPQNSIISAGIDNRYGHPHEETVGRLKKTGSKVYSTQDNGAIMMTVTGEGSYQFEKATIK